MILLPKECWEVQNTKRKGRGVFAKKDIEAGVVVGDYIGKVIKTSEEEIYEKDDELFLMYYHDQATIYPDSQKIGIHILNHSCTPNTWMYTYKGHTLYFTVRRIFAGEELTVSYMLDPIDKSCNPCIHACYCTSVICSGTMHLQKERYKRWQQFDNEQAEKTKRERIKFGEDLPLLSSYPHNIPDNKIYTLFGSVEKSPIIFFDEKLPGILELRKRIRESGRVLNFPKLNKKIFGIQDNNMFSKTLFDTFTLNQNYI